MAPFMAIDSSLKTSSWKGTSDDFYLAWSRLRTTCCSTKLSGTMHRKKRRQALRHHAATTSATDIRITQGHDCAIHSQILDPFDAYPLNLDGNPESTAAWLVVSTSK